MFLASVNGAAMLATLFSVFLDYQCNFSCSHCSVGSNPHTKFPMARETLLNFFEQLKDIPTRKVVVFTGGEATIHKDLLLEGIRLSHAQGCRTRLVSNGWWAKSRRKAIDYVRVLKEAGLDELNTSYDDYHEPFIGIEKIAHLIHGALQNDLAVGLGVIVDKAARWDQNRIAEALCSELSLTREELLARVTIVYDYPTPSGSGDQLDVSGLDAGAKLDLGCPEIIKTLSIHPNGGVKACCGHVMFYSKDLALGNLNEEPLAHIVARAQKNLLYWWVQMTGPKRILEKLGVRADYASICHACQDLLVNHRDELRAYLKEHPQEIFTDGVLLADNIKKMSAFILANENSILRV